MLRPPVPTLVRAAAIGEFDEAAWVQHVRFSWTQPGGPEDVESWRIEALQPDVPSAMPPYIDAMRNPTVVELGPGLWSVKVAAIVGEQESFYSRPASITVAEPAPIQVGLPNITVMPQAERGCRPYRGLVTGTAEVFLDRPAPFPIDAEADSESGEATLSDPTGGNLFVVVPPGQTMAELDTGMYRAGDGETARFAGNVGLPLGAAGFANLSLEYGNANRTDRAAPRRDAIALIAAGNAHVASDHPQAWGDPQVDDDLKLFGNFGHTLPAGAQAYAHTGYASKTVTSSVFYRNPNTRLGVFSNDRGRTLLVGDVLAANGMGSADCPTVTVTDNVPDPVALRQVFDDPNCFTFQEVFPGGFTPQRRTTAADASLVGGLRGSTAGGFDWDLSGALGVHRTDFFTRNTINASLGPTSPNAFYVGTNRQRDVNVNFDASYAVSDRVHVAAGAEWRDEQYGVRAGDRAGWEIGPYAAQRFMGRSNGAVTYSPAQAGAWSRRNLAAYGDLEVTGAAGAWTLGAAARVEDFEDFGTTANGKVSGRVGFVRGSVSTGFRAPTPGQQHGLHIQSWFDPTVGDLVNNAVIPSISPVARLRGGRPLGPERSVNTTAGVVLDRGSFTLTADYFRVDVSDRIGITSNFALTAAETAEVVAGGFAAAESVRNYRFFTNAFGTTSQGIDVVSTWTPLALRGNTVVSAVFNHTDTEVTDNALGLLDGRRLAEYAYALPRTRWNVGVTQRLGRASLCGRLSYYSGWYDYDSGYGETFDPAGGLAQGFFDGRPILDVELSVDLGRGTTLSIGGQNVFDTYSQESVIANLVGERYSEYMPWGYSGAYYYARLGYGWGN